MCGTHNFAQCAFTVRFRDKADILTDINGDNTPTVCEMTLPVSVAELTSFVGFRELQLLKNLHSVLMHSVFFEAQFKQWYPHAGNLTEPQNAH